MPVVEAIPFVIFCYGNPSKPTQYSRNTDPCSSNLPSVQREKKQLFQGMLTFWESWLSTILYDIVILMWT